MSKIVIYHANCYDGVTAAWVCYRALDPAFEGMTSDVEYVPCNYSDPPPNVKDKDVFIVDFSFKRYILEKMRGEARSLLILDHHKTAQEDLKGFPNTVFDMNRSGAGITWDWFFPPSNRPNLVNYIEDRDLWKFQLPSSKEVNAFIQSFDINLETWIRDLVPAFQIRDLREIVEEGKSLLRLENKYVKSICYNAELKRISDAHIGPYVQTAILMSEVCDYLIKNYPGNYPFAWYSFKRKDGKYQYGLRSRSDFDVSIIAKSFNGGGHKQAAGFELDYQL
jgi:oligoribonuclease NrnB/cAMP/cGMP phosphodiesterase (DHH superfamily)